ncbi:MAG: RNA polymerase sigma factor (sigma-70 family) [Planctomycetota bacterium]
MEAMTDRSIHEQDLLDQLGWVRSLASQVVGDPTVADDLSQDAMLVALTTNGGRPNSLKAWLAAVVRNLGMTSKRSETRRAFRETSTGRTEALPATDEIVERAAAHRVLVEALMDLDEPFRSTLLLRFFDELSPKEIAKRLDVSESTVATRTAEGIGRLRAHFERTGEFATRAWIPLFLTNRFARIERPWGASVTTSLSGFLALVIQFKVAIGLVAILGIVLAVNETSDPTTVGAPIEAFDDAIEQQSRIALPFVDNPRTPVETSPPPSKETPKARSFDEIPEHAGLFQMTPEKIQGHFSILLHL